MRATLVTPDGPGPYPGVLVLHTSGGLEDADIAFANALAREGYVCIVPAFMSAYGLTAASRQDTFTRDANPIYADFVSALDALKNNPKVQGSKLAAVGFSNGGYFAVWLALANNVQAAVGYYGAYSGAGTDKDLSRFAKIASASSAPILILHGANDTTVPVQAARRLARILESAQAPYEIQVYPDTGHLFDRGGFSPAATFRRNSFQTSAGRRRGRCRCLHRCLDADAPLSPRTSRAAMKGPARRARISGRPRKVQSPIRAPEARFLTTIAKSPAAVTEIATLHRRQTRCRYVRPHR